MKNKKCIENERMNEWSPRKDIPTPWRTTNTHIHTQKHLYIGTIDAMRLRCIRVDGMETIKSLLQLEF
jgi:hypothetical protein